MKIENDHTVLTPDLARERLAEKGLPDLSSWEKTLRMHVEQRSYATHEVRALIHIAKGSEVLSLSHLIEELREADNGGYNWY